MKHIIEQYGEPVNYLHVSGDDFKQLEPFLLGLGIRCRVMMTSWEDGVMYHDIQAENPYKFWNTPEQRRIADSQLTPFAISCYKR